MKSHSELTKRQFRKRSIIEEAVNKLKYNTTKAANTLVIPYVRKKLLGSIFTGKLVFEDWEISNH